jgi:iron complex transport system substrate-binding protein
MLQKFGVRVVELALVSNLDDGRRQIAEVAALLGHPDRGQAMIAALDAAERKLSAAPRPASRTALVLDREGYTQGADSLVAALVAKAGLVPPAGAPPGYGGFLALETILTLKPDVLVLRDPPEVPTDQGSLALLHPALMTMYPASRRIALPTRYTFCGGPALVGALDYLVQEMTRLAQPAAR